MGHVEDVVEGAAPGQPDVPESRRERQRRELVGEITDEARRQLERGGRAAVSWRALARHVGMSPASLYTYFASLDDLFTALLLQSYGRLADAVRRAIDAFAGAPVGDRLLVGPLAYRRWALANRAQFNLVFTDQLPGYAAVPGGPTVEAQMAVFRPMAAVVVEALGRPWEPSVMAEPGRTRELFLGLWGTFHGLTSLEVNHHLDWVDAADLFERHLRWHLDRLGLPAAAPDLATRVADLA
jgi:AcrR family transcriptional regulator